MSQQLRFTAGRNLNAFPDLQYQQVVDNLAKIASNPGFLPYLAVAGARLGPGDRQRESALALNMSPRRLGTGRWARGLTKRDGNVEHGNDHKPGKDPEHAGCLSPRVRGAAEGDPAFGWLNMGSKEELPKQVNFMSRYEKTFVWVKPEGVEGLSDLTLAIMDIATSEDIGGAHVSDSGGFRGMAQPLGVPRRNFQIPSVGPVFTPGGH